MSTLVQQALENGILDERVHEQLLVRLDSAAKRAGIPAEAICRHLREYVNDEERAWCKSVMRNRRNPSPGLVYEGRWRSGVDDRMSGLAGAFIRNFIDARVMHVRRAIEERPRCLVLLIPNFLPEQGKAASWQLGDAAEIVMERMHEGRVTVLHVADREDLVQVAGRGFADALDRNFKIVRDGRRESR